MKLGTIIGTRTSLALDLDTLIATRALVTATSGGGKSWALRQRDLLTISDLRRENERLKRGWRKAE